MKFNKIKNLNWVHLDNYNQITGLSVLGWSRSEPVDRGDMIDFLNSLIASSAQRLKIPYVFMKILFKKRNRDFYLQFDRIFDKNCICVDSCDRQFLELESMILVPYQDNENQNQSCKKSKVKKFMDDVASLDSKQIERMEKELFNVLTYLNL